MTPAAVAVIRAAALRNNLQRVREAAPGCRVLAVIKANAYGHGLVAVAGILDTTDGFAVARIEEAIQLREEGVTHKVVVLGGLISPEEARLAARHRLDVVVHCPEHITILERERNIGPLEVWLKVDSGMGRLGIEPAAVADSVRRLNDCANVARPLRLMTHLASADIGDDLATAEQLERFAHSIGRWPGDISIANSAGTLQWPATLHQTSKLRYDGENWVRPGLMLYGVSPFAGRSAQSLGLQPAMSFETRLMAIRRLPRGSRVGYGGDWCAQRDSVIGVAAAGYADGYPWHIARITPVLVNGQLTHVVGRVSMDMITIDLTDLPAARLGDPVVLWGEIPMVTEIAGHAGTIPYELLAGMSPRVLRLME